MRTIIKAFGKALMAMLAIILGALIINVSMWLTIQNGVFGYFMTFLLLVACVCQLTALHYYDLKSKENSNE